MDVGLGYQRADGFEWGFDQKAKTLFVKGDSVGAEDSGVLWEYYKDSIKSIFISEGVEVIRDGVFQGLSELERVSIPSSVMTITSNPFTDCPKLTRIKISEDKPGFITEDGVLFKREDTPYLLSANNKWRL